jgi:uncharacterized protein
MSDVISQSEIAWDVLWAHLAGCFTLGEETIHGLDHWRRVEAHGVWLAERTGGDVVVARLFAAFHDVRRLSDGTDAEHGARGAALATQLHHRLFTLAAPQLELLQYACIWHTSGRLSDDPTIGACWDADRLDIWRAGYTPQERYMSTAPARALVRAGRVGPVYTPPGCG